MTTKVLHPQDYLAGRQMPCPRRRHDKKRSSHGKPVVAAAAAGGLVIGKVRLLRRGESLNSKIPKPSEESLEITPSAPTVEIYAGTASFNWSPSPRSVPVPTFFNKKDESNSFEDGATIFLRRVLHLE